jgi:integrase/recombinase XerD
MRRGGIIIGWSEWPAREKALWEAGVRPPTVLDGEGVAAHWRKRTVEAYEFAYGRWLGWLKETHQLDPEASPDSRVTRDWLRVYIETLQGLNAPATVFNRVVGLERALAVMVPEMDRGFLRAVINKLPRGSDPARKRALLQESAALMELGLMLMGRADEATNIADVRRNASQFRDGFQIALLALRPFRIKNFAEMELGKNLLQRGDTWWLTYTEVETKNRKFSEVQLPEALLPWLLKYLSHYRPLLAGDRYRGDRLWVSMHYRAQWKGTIYQKIKSLTEEAFGKGLSPHLFRDALATSLAINDPEIVNTAHVMLGNSLATTERFYNLAQSIEAGRAVNSALISLRHRLRPNGLKY